MCRDSPYSSRPSPMHSLPILSLFTEQHLVQPRKLADSRRSPTLRGHIGVPLGVSPGAVHPTG